VIAVAAVGLTVAAGAAVSTAGVLTIGEDLPTVTVSPTGALAVAEGGLTGAGASTVGALAVAGAAGSTTGVMTVSEGGITVAVGAAAAAAQCSEIMLSSVIAKLLSAAPEPTAPLAL
jgi:hypothetical protein